MSLWKLAEPHGHLGILRLSAAAFINTTEPVRRLWSYSDCREMSLSYSLLVKLRLYQEVQ